MQLQKVNNTNPQPNFQARNLSRVVSTAKNGVKSVIDVYSVDKKDEAFLNRFAEALKGQHLPQDSLMIGGKNAKASVLDAIKNILSPNRHYDDGLLVAVEDKKNIAGILDENLRVYRDTIKLVEEDIKWHNTEDFWYSAAGYYQSAGIWGTSTASEGVYLSQTYDIGAVLECIVSFDIQYTSADEQSNVLVEWALSDDGENFSDWTIVNTGKYTFRYCKFRVTLKAYNNVQTVLTTLNVAVDVPDKDLDLELEITNKNGLTINYSFIRPPSIVATVNDNNDAYVVVTEKTNTYAVLKAYTNSGELTTCKLSLRAKGY